MKAIEMFEALGYKPYIYSTKTLTYEKKRKQLPNIRFDLINKQYHKSHKITLEEHKAINKQIEEFRW